jgi:putative PIN family toxin of toxin-antitoxin system
MRVVIDTNVFISSVISTKGAPAQLFKKWLDGAFEIIVSDAIMIEYQTALRYEHVRKRHGLTSPQMEKLLDDFLGGVTLVTPTEAVHSVTNDPDDNKFLECAQAGGAEFIISGDKHLLNLKEYEDIQILSPSAFLLLLSGEYSIS